VARISRTIADGKYYVTVLGRLTRSDLKRLERMCGPALEHRELALEIRLTDSMAFDASTLFFLRQLRSRGAVVTGAWEADARSL